MPIVLTSKLADKHFNNIVNQHNDILEGINNQTVRVKEYQQDQEMKQQADKEMKITTDRDMLTQQNKQQELAIKQAALSI